MMADVESRIHDFFKKRLKSHPQIAQPHQVHGWNEEHRARAFDQTSKYGFLEKNTSSYITLMGSVYSVHVSTLITIFAVYDDALLWLDDHTDNADFGFFIRREKLLDWIPDRFSDLITLIAETKLNFWGFPRIISSTSDIPPIAERYRAYLTSDEWEAWEKRLTDVVDQIYSPRFTVKENGTLELNFCIWTNISGNVIDLSCSFDSKQDFAYSGKILARATGNYYVPR
jgi:hypothetical protein